MTDLAILAVVVAVVAVVTIVLRQRNGRVREVHGPILTAAQRRSLGAPAGQHLLVEFTAPGCRPCGAARAVLSGVAEEREDVALVLADVGEHLDLARAHHVLRAPTTLVVGPDGAVHHRISGVPAPEVVAELLDGGQRARAV